LAEHLIERAVLDRRDRLAVNPFACSSACTSIDWTFQQRPVPPDRNRQQLLDRADRIRGHRTQRDHRSRKLRLIDLDTHRPIGTLVLLEVLLEHLTGRVSDLVERRPRKTKLTAERAHRAVCLLACQHHCGTLHLLGSRQGGAV
jgi:hypothetical protein